MGIFSERIAIDLGTAFSVVAHQSSKHYWRIASSVAFDRSLARFVAFGDEAKEMSGRCPEKYEVIRPLRDGVISDFRATNCYLNHLLDQATRRSFAIHYDIFLCVPWGATAVELQSYLYSLRRRRCRVQLIREPFAAALGCGQDILSEKFNTIIDMGGGTTEIATIRGGYMVQASSLRHAGNYCDQLIMDAIRSEKAFEIGISTAEQIKMSHGSVWFQAFDDEIPIKGSRRETRRPELGSVCVNDLAAYLEPYALKVEQKIKEHLGRLSTEAKRAVEMEGISLAGGTSLLKGWKERLEPKLGIPIRLTDRPTHGVIRGMRKIIQNPRLYENVIRISEKVYSS